jgi:hypothetical protein
MHPQLTIEVPDEDLAEALRLRLYAFDVGTVEVDAHWEVRIQLLERNPERRVTTALHEIDAWLVDTGVESVRVHLDESSYTLHAPTGASVAAPSRSV